jgi:hypothetical protein
MNQNQSTETVTTESAPVTKSLADEGLTFSEYEAIRRGETVKAEVAEPAAPTSEGTSEQKESTESATEETAAKDDEQNEEAEGDEPEAKEGEKPKKKGGFQRRIDKLNARNAQTASELEALRRELAELKSAGEKPKTQATAPADKPKAEDFESHADYVDALTDWKIEQRESKAKAEAEQAKLAEQHNKLRTTHLERVQAFAAKTPDLEDVTEDVSHIPHSAAFESEILRSENGPELYYELAKTPAEFERIQKLSPMQVARELGKLEVKLAARAAEAKKPEPKKITQAPKPIAPVGKSAAPVSKDPEAMTFAEYERMRREQLRKRRA